MAEVDAQRTKTELISIEQELAIKESDSKESEVMSSEDRIRRNNKTDSKSENSFENHVNSSSSSNPTIEDAKNDAVSSGDPGRSENNLAEIAGSEREGIVKTVVVKSVEWVQVESNVVYVGKAGKEFESLQQKNGIGKNPESFENHVHDISATNIEDDKSTRGSEDIKNNNVGIKDDLKNDDLSSRENRLVQNNVVNGEKGFNDDSVDLTLGHVSDIEQIPEMTLENILEEDSTTPLNSQVIIEDVFTSGRIEIQDDSEEDDVGTKEWVQIESNLDYMGKEDDPLAIQDQLDNEIKKTVGIVTESHDHETSPLNSQTIENSLDSRKQEDAENKMPEIHVYENSKHDLKSGESAQIVLADIDIHDALKKDDLSPRECAKSENRSDGDNVMTVNSDVLTSTASELIDSNMMDCKEDIDNNIVSSMQQQHEEEMQELRTNLQHEYQNQVLKISDELRDHYQNDMDEKIAKLEADWELEFTRQKQEFDGQVSAVQREQWTQCEEAIERVTLDAEDQLKNMKCSYERETAEHKQRIRELLEREALWEMKEKELANEKSEKENESISKIKKLENQLSFEREEIESQLSSAQDELKTLRKQHESEIENLTNELDKKYSDIVDEMRRELKSKYQNEMDNKVNQVESHLREQYEQDLEKTKEEVQQSTSTLKTKYERQVADVLSQLEELYERNQEHELREAKLKEKFESEKTKVAELLNELEQKTKMVEEFEQNKNDLKTLEEKFKQCFSEKCSLEEKVKGYSESMTKETVHVQDELARKSNVIHDMEQQQKDSKTKLKELEEKLQNVTVEKNCIEKKLNEDLQSEKLNVEGLRNELEIKEKEIERLQQKDLEDKTRTKILNDKPSLDEAVQQSTESQNNEVKSSQQDLQKNQNEIKNDEAEELEVKLREMKLEKQSLQQQLVDSKSEITALQEKLNEDENVANELKSNYDAKILQIKRNFQEEVSALENELKLKKNGEEEISRLNEELQKHKATISELEETSRGREIEIANLILNSPSPHGLTEQEFDFSENSGDKTQQLEKELAKYKKKVQELEEEAEDKFETNLCPNCQDREKSEEILIQTKALVDKIQLDCEKKVQSMSKDLEKMESVLQEQMGESKDLRAKLEKAEEDLREERKRSLEISNIGKHFDVNRNVLGYEETIKVVPGTEGVKPKEEQIEALKPIQSELGQQDGKTQNDNSASELPSNKDFESLFDEQEKFYKNEISKKDEEISRLMNENKKTQQRSQNLKENLKEKLDEGEAQYEQLKMRTLEQKTKYENEINLMQKEIETLIQENKDVKDQLKIIQGIQNETESLQRKLKESENVAQGKFQEVNDLNEKLQETENMLKQNSSKYEQEIVILKEVVQEKENCMLDLRNSLDLLEKSKDGLELDISNQKQEFSKRERNLLHEISEMTIAFEDEKAKILEESFLDKEELKQKVHALEMLIHEYNFTAAEDDIRGFEGIEGDLIPHEWTSHSKGKLMDVRPDERINWDNLLDEHSCDGETFGYEQVPLETSHMTRNMRGHEWSEVDRKATRGTAKEIVPACSEKVKYEEISYYPSENFKHRDEIQSDDDDEVLKIGKEAERIIREDDGKHKQELEALSEFKREALKDEYTLFDDAEFDTTLLERSPGSLFSDGRYKEIGCEENLELLKYEHDVDLLLARKENERLRAEIGTLTDCVDVFHDECNSLKRSLDKTLNVVGMLREERDDLMKKHNLNMAEHSELVLDLIKYEETIDRLERGNEKLEDDRKLLEECLMGKQSTSFQKSPTEKQAKLSKTSYPLQDGRRKLLQEHRAENRALFPNSPVAERSMQLDLEVYPFLPNDTPILRTNSEYETNETEFQRNRDKRKKDDVDGLERHDVLERRESPILEDLVKEAELEFRNDLLQEKTKDMKKQGQDGNRKPTAYGIKMQFAKDNERLDFARTLSSMDSSRDMKTQTQDENLSDRNRLPISHNNKGCNFRKETNNHNKRNYEESDISPQHTIKIQGNRPFSKYRYEAQTSELNLSAPPRYAKEVKSLRATKPPETTKIRSNPRLVDVTERPSLLREKEGTKQTSKFKDNSVVFSRNDAPYSSHNSLEAMRNVTPSSRFTKRRERNGIAERQKSLKSKSKIFSSKRVPGTFLANASTASSPNYSNSSILTSTRANVTTTADRLVPNLSGLSPIVSPLDRHYHAQKLKWQIVEDKRSNASRLHDENTTFLVEIDPNELLQTPTTANRERLVSRRTGTHNRSRSADDRLLTSEMTLSRELYQEKPLLINFEDFICRHRVKSSEDVANIRDPSPAELWFS